MAETPISSLASLLKANVNVSDDFLNIVDFSDKSMSVNGTNKKITVADLVGSITDAIESDLSLLAINTTNSIVSLEANKLDEADFLFDNMGGKPTTLLGYGITDAQPVNANLTEIAALTTTSYGRSLLTQNDAGAARTTLGLGTLATQDGTISDYLAKAGGTMTGALLSNLGTITTNTPGISLTQTWNNTSNTSNAYNLISGTVSFTANPSIQNASTYFNFNASGFSDRTAFLRAFVENGHLFISGQWGDGAISLGTVGVKLTAVYGSGLVVTNTASGGAAIFTAGWASRFMNHMGSGGIGAAYSFGVSGGAINADIVCEAANVIGFRNSTNAQTWRLYGTYTDASNYRRLYASSTTGGAFTLGVEGAGTGASGNTLTVLSDSISSSGSFTAAAGVFSGGIGVGGVSALNATHPINLPVYTWINWAGTAYITSDPGIGLRLNNCAIQNLTYLGFGSSNTTVLTFDANDTLAQRRSTNAQIWRLYGTYTDASNYRRFYVSSTTGGTFTLGVEGLGTGASGNTLSFAHSVFTVDGAGFISGGGNGGLGLGGGFYVRSAGSDVARFYADSGSGRLLSTSDFRYQASAHRFRNTADSADAPVYASAGIFSGGLSVQGGNISLTSSSPGAARLEMTSQQYTPSNLAINIPWGTGSTHGIYGSNGLVGFASSGTAYFEVNTAGLVVANNRYVALGGTIASPQTLLFSGGSNVLEQRNGTNPQVLRIYNAFIDSSNYDRGFIRWNSNVFEIGTEILGSYTTARAMVFASGGSCSIQTNGATRFSVGTNGQVVIAGAFSGASGANSIALVGDFLNVTGQNAVGHGGIPGVGGATVAATNSFGICGGGTQTGADGSFAHGFTAIARIYSARAFASHRFSTNGDVQGIEAVLRNKTTDATPTILNANSVSNRLTVPSGKVMHLFVNVTGVKSDGSAVAVYLRQVTIKNVAGTTALVGTVNTIGVDQTSGTNLNIVADDGNDALQIEVTGIVGETWRWEAIVYGSDLTYGT